MVVSAINLRLILAYFAQNVVNVHPRCAKIKRVTTTLAKGFVCWRCLKTIKELDKEISFFIGLDGNENNSENVRQTTLGQNSSQ